MAQQQLLQQVSTEVTGSILLYRRQPPAQLEDNKLARNHLAPMRSACTHRISATPRRTRQPFFSAQNTYLGSLRTKVTTPMATSTKRQSSDSRLYPKHNAVHVDLGTHAQPANQPQTRCLPTASTSSCTVAQPTLPNLCDRLVEGSSGDVEQVP